MLDIQLIYTFLRNSSYWAKGRSYEVVKKSIVQSLCFGVYFNVQKLLQQVGFARIVTDYATFAWLCDIFIMESHREEGLEKWLL